ncbi:MAG TPA: hypothetical protein VF821_22165 [Lentzea sp.]
MTRSIKTIDIKQKGVKQLQRRLARHRDELNVHADHLTDLRLEVNRVEVAARNAAAALERAIAALGGEK